MSATVTEQGFLTVIAEVAEGQVPALSAHLKAIGDVVDKPECPIDFRKFTRVHFMRWVVLEPGKDVDGKDIPAQLVLSTDHDLPLEAHLDELVREAEPQLDRIYTYCRDYPGPAGLRSYLLAHRVSSRQVTFYCGTRGRSVAQIRDEAKLREAIQARLDQRWRGCAANTEPAAIRADIQKFVFDQPDLAWARAKPSWAVWRLRLYGPLLVLLLIWLVACVLVPLVFGPAWVWAVPVGTAVVVLAPLLFLRQVAVVHERRDWQDDINNDAVQRRHVKALVEREDRVVQNQLSHLVNVKPERFRLTILRVVLGVIHLLARYYYVRGELGDIPTIHFARWVIIDGGRRLLFFSNFDGSWENYLGDFIDKAAPGLTAVWSNTVGCPRARGLIRDGASDEQRFKSWTREHQIFTHVWYSAYEALTVDNINNNSAIRMGLYGRLSDTATKEWLARL
jgi:hypothetical protein